MPPPSLLTQGNVNITDTHRPHCLRVQHRSPYSSVFSFAHLDCSTIIPTKTGQLQQLLQTGTLSQEVSDCIHQCEITGKCRDQGMVPVIQDSHPKVWVGGGQFPPHCAGGRGTLCGEGNPFARQDRQCLHVFGSAEHDSRLVIASRGVGYLSALGASASTFPDVAWCFLLEGSLFEP